IESHGHVCSHSVRRDSVLLIVRQFVQFNGHFRRVTHAALDKNPGAALTPVQIRSQLDLTDTGMPDSAGRILISDAEQPRRTASNSHVAAINCAALEEYIRAARDKNKSRERITAGKTHTILDNEAWPDHCVWIKLQCQRLRDQRLLVVNPGTDKHS